MPFFYKEINNPNVLELGTGSGAVSIALPKRKPLNLKFYGY
ncbi:MAG: hypothetical protein Ct9H300mP6_01320 [Gammaproteobacteria bacterium]|nr:MAG: hypothetical protein Ct9H300mP6_01320 [Gammaproteobacteria bacterium]